MAKILPQNDANLGTRVGKQCKKSCQNWLQAKKASKCILLLAIFLWWICLFATHNYNENVGNCHIISSVQCSDGEKIRRRKIDVWLKFEEENK